MANAKPSAPDADTPTQILRRAAQAMRRNVDAAVDFRDAVAGDPLPWVSHETSIYDMGAAPIAAAADEDKAVYIKKWHPTIALMVAQWLEDVAHQWTDNPTHARRAWFDQNRAEAIARAYLGNGDA